MSAFLGKIENGSIYVTSSLRGALPDYHVAIFISTNKPTGEMWHAINPSGGWFMESKTTKNIANSISLCVCLKVGIVTDQTWGTLRTTLENVPCAGQPSVNTGEKFSCQIWVGDALLALHDAGVIQLTMGIEDIKKKLANASELNRAPATLLSWTPLPDSTQSSRAHSDPTRTWHKVLQGYISRRIGNAIFPYHKSAR
jgi:hypothetical protein